MWKSIICCSLLLVLVLSVSCTRQKELPKFNAATNVSHENLNTQIELSDSDVSNSYRNSEILSIIVTNISDRPVVFADDFGVKVYTVRADEWVEVQNSYSYKENAGTLPPNKDVPVGFVIKLQPFLPNLDTPQTIRVLVTGYPENNKNQPVGAYIDVTLLP